MPHISFWIWLSVCYVAGTVPFGLLIGLMKGVDIRTQGSGNIGATNLGRVLGKKWGLICFVLDVAKGLLPVLLCGLMTERGQDMLVGESANVSALLWLAMGIATVLGHVFPIWLKFKGGKGVATSLGMLLGFFPVLTYPALAGFVIWLIVVNLSGYVSLASCVAALALPVLAWFSCVYFGESVWVFTSLVSVVGVLVVVLHRSNLARLMAGTEVRVSWSWRGRRLTVHE